uniref:Uncharacterized protein n=1 Tax=Anguilla anguilla TaxID=7936 RepID=A0A0E9XE80_ANGAN
MSRDGTAHRTPSHTFLTSRHTQTCFFEHIKLKAVNVRLPIITTFLVLRGSK